MTIFLASRHSDPSSCAAHGVSSRLLVPRRDRISRIGESDPLPWYFLPFVGWLFRQRLQMALDLLDLDTESPESYERILEAGYGSGILLPSLAQRAARLFAVDLHQQGKTVGGMLAAERVAATLATGSVTRLGYAAGSFDALVCISTLEHLHGPELEAALDELHRVLRPGGVAIVGVPASGWLMDLLFRAIGFHEIHDHHVSTRGDIETALRRQFVVEDERHLPALSPAASLYAVYRCRRA